ncbi:MAG TPA: hypothetical protein VF974_02235 [Patescibacteria group bacterium]
MAIKLISGRTDFNRKILVIGCSNLRHNIDFDKVRDSIKAGIDFLIFSGSENSTYLKFLVDENETSAYTDIVLYVPYHILQENSFLVKNDYNYRELGCFKYSIDIIKRSPEFFFYDWSDYYNLISLHRAPEPPEKRILHTDKYMDSLEVNETTYRYCTEKFVYNKHIIVVPDYLPKDTKYIRSLCGENQHLFILFTPLPDIKENRALTDKISGMKKNFRPVNMLNEPFLMDSIFFYDQWYHLNHCGKEIESNNMIKSLKKVFN